MKKGSILKTILIILTALFVILFIAFSAAVMLAVCPLPPTLPPAFVEREETLISKTYGKLCPVLLELISEFPASEAIARSLNTDLGTLRENFPDLVGVS